MMLIVKSYNLQDKFTSQKRIDRRVRVGQSGFYLLEAERQHDDLKLSPLVLMKMMIER